MNTEESRKQFEVWCKQRGYIERYYFFRQSHPNHYDDDQIEEMWNAWQAAKAQAVPQWIPVSERLPDDGQFVLAVIGGSVQQYTFSVREGWRESQDDCSVSYAVKDQVVTHWMSLPSPPAAPRDASMPNHI